MEHKNEIKICQNCKKDFVIESEDFVFYGKMQVPPPTWCPDCRAMRRMTWRNERSLYHNKCAFSRKNVVSMFSPETKLTVYDRDIWWSDKWDATEYSMDYDPSRNFFEQWRELFSRVPLANLGNSNVINSEYGNHLTDCKNCYLSYASFTNENLNYSQGSVNSKDSMDLCDVMNMEFCYEDVLCARCYKLFFSYISDDCMDSMFLTLCANLQHCLGCVNLRHKNYCIFNKQYSKEEYEKKLVEYDLGSYKNLLKFKKEYEDFIKKEPRRFAMIIKSQDVTGDNVFNSKNSKNIFISYGGVEDSKYTMRTVDMRDGYDGYGIGAGGEFLYEGLDFGVDSARNYFGVLNHRCMDTFYTYMCYSSKDLFGCVGIRSKQFCILNKQYSKEEYEKLIDKIKKDMDANPYIDKKGRTYKFGEFFPPELSPFYYNETIAQDYYPLEKKDADKYGFQWKEKENKNYNIEIKTGNLPDHIKDVSDEIIGKVIECAHKGLCEEQCTEAFKIREDDLRFYRSNSLPLPRLCPNCRHYQRLKQRNPPKLWHRQCMCEKENHEHKGKCENEFETSYAPERSEIIYCEKCYQQEVY